MILSSVQTQNAQQFYGRYNVSQLLLRVIAGEGCAAQAAGIKLKVLKSKASYPNEFWPPFAVFFWLKLPLSKKHALCAFQKLNNLNSIWQHVKVWRTSHVAVATSLTQWAPAPCGPQQQQHSYSLNWIIMSPILCSKLGCYSISSFICYRNPGKRLSRLRHVQADVRWLLAAGPTSARSGLIQ